MASSQRQPSDASPTALRARAAAKVNLGLYVGPVRADGKREADAYGRTVGDLDRRQRAGAEVARAVGRERARDAAAVDPDRGARQRRGGRSIHHPAKDRPERVGVRRHHPDPEHHRETATSIRQS